MQRFSVERRAGGQFHELPEVHNRDAIRDVPDHAEVVGDEQIGEAVLLLEVFEQIDDLRLNGHVQGGNGFVTDNELRIERKRPCNADALPLASGELMGVAVRELGVHAHRLQQFLHPFPACLALGDTVFLQRFPNDAAHRHAGIEAVLRILKDHLHFGPQFAHPLRA